ncbi:protein kinase [Luteococcus sp. H138]|uniref:serine/threonine-protein kinase n=1 Tax=unclassified Luteococcus TaxID=2639923 RepID=UPI00313ADB3A
MGQIYAGRYELVDLLETGGVGAVWRVWDRREQAYRAGKVLQQSDSTALLRFVRETGWRIHHPHIVMPLGWAGEDDRIIFTMPLVHGGSLATVLADHGQLPVSWVLELADQLLDALAAVHAQGLVHRDIKPGNILLEPGHRPDVKLGDFGIAAPVGEPRLTRSTEVIGTPGYLSPEALAGADPDPRQDLWAVGSLMVQLLTGQRPGAVVEVPAAWRGNPLGQWVEALLAPVDQRIPTAAQAREALRTLNLADLDAPGVLLDGEVEAFDQIPDLPPGWGAHGPQTWRRPEAVAASSAEPPATPVPTIVEPVGETEVLAASSPAEPEPAQGMPLAGLGGRGSEAAYPASVAEPVEAPLGPVAEPAEPRASLGVLSIILIGLGLLLLALALQLS